MKAKAVKVHILWDDNQESDYEFNNKDYILDVILEQTTVYKRIEDRDVVTGDTGFNLKLNLKCKEN